MNLVDLYRTRIEQALERADRYDSKCSRALLRMEGMSGKKTRHFYNALCAFPDTRYLEIGTWKGSTLCAALEGNQIQAVAIDNWSYSPEDIRSEFWANLTLYKGDNVVRVLEQSCWDVKDIGMTCNVYLYDGDHTTESHEKALTHFLTSLDDVFIYIVDDWNDPRVRRGTLSGISAASLQICYRRDLLTSDDGVHPSVHSQQSDWHNGIAMFVLQKPTCRS